MSQCVYSLSKFDQLIEPFVYRSSSNSRKGSTVTVPLERDDDDSDSQPPEGFVTEAELNAQQQRTWRQLRIAELLRRYSSGSDLIVVYVLRDSGENVFLHFFRTLPVPRRGLTSPALVMIFYSFVDFIFKLVLGLAGNDEQ